MTEQITITIPQQLYRRARELALSRNQPVDDVLAHVLDEALPPDVAPEFDDTAVEREMQAYIALHPMLKQQYLGQHVAIYGGQLVDVDTDYGALYTRIDAQYPDEFVWLTTVAEEPMPTQVFRSPRFVTAA